MDHSASLVIPADLAEIRKVAAAIDDAGRASGFSDSSIGELQLAVEEALANTIVHGYRGAPGDVAIAIRAAPREVSVRLEDDAPPFDPFTAPDPDRGSDLEGRPIGGLGVFLIREMTDEVAYRYEGGRNVLTLVKRRTS